MPHKCNSFLLYNKYLFQWGWNSYCYFSLAMLVGIFHQFFDCWNISTCYRGSKLSRKYIVNTNLIHFELYNFSLLLHLGWCKIQASSYPKRHFSGNLVSSETRVWPMNLPVSFCSYVMYTTQWYSSVVQK